MLIPAKRVRVIDVDLTAIARRNAAPPPQTAAAFRERRDGTAAPAPAPAPAPAAPPTRFKLAADGRTNADDGSTTNGLLEIRAAMPTMDDSWDVEDVVQYRKYYGKEKWLIKWKGYGEDQNSWEPMENLLEDWVKQRAADVKRAAEAARSG